MKKKNVLMKLFGFVFFLTCGEAQPQESTINMQGDAVKKAIQQKDLESLKKLIFAKNSNNPINEEGETPLMYAIKQNNLTAVNYLLGIKNGWFKKGSAINLSATDLKGRAAIHYAAIGAQPEILEALIKTGANLQMPDNITKATPLHLAVTQGQSLPIVKLLIDQCPKCLHVRDLFHDTPLHSAAGFGHPEAVTLIIHALQKSDDKQQIKMFINDTNNNNQTPLHLVAHETRLSGLKEGNRTLDRGMTAQILISQGASLTATDKDGNTPLHFAAKNGHLDIIKAMYTTIPQEYANHKDEYQKKLMTLLTIKNKNGQTPLQMAEPNENLKGTKGERAQEITKFLKHQQENFIHESHSKISSTTTKQTAFFKKALSTKTPLFSQQPTVPFKRPLPVKTTFTFQQPSFKTSIEPLAFPQTEELKKAPIRKLPPLPNQGKTPAQENQEWEMFQTKTSPIRPTTPAPMKKPLIEPEVFKPIIRTK